MYTITIKGIKNLFITDRETKNFPWRCESIISGLIVVGELGFIALMSWKQFSVTRADGELHGATAYVAIY